MSVYSGFTTRQQETFYNKLLQKALVIVITKFIEVCPLSEAGVFTDIKFAKDVRKIYLYLVKMDKQKHLEPKFSESLGPLYEFLKANGEETSDATSTITSQLSIFKSTNTNKMSAEFKMAQLNQVLAQPAGR